MKSLIVLAHPLDDSLTGSVARHIASELSAAGSEIEFENLYASGFDPVMAPDERRLYYDADPRDRTTIPEAARLIEANTLVLVFPTWWFGPPAILKGWFDRIWTPGVAYDWDAATGAMKPRLANLQKVLVVTTLGAPWWVDWLVIRRPVRRILRTALIGNCAPRCSFSMLCLYQAEEVSEERLERFRQRISGVIAKW